jgi:hypothetical protein
MLAAECRLFPERKKHSAISTQHSIVKISALSICGDFNRETERLNAECSLLSAACFPQVSTCLNNIPY